ncbi:MAG: hypothetical protein GXY44_02970 [Phycisphaerales bacterium]|nr:hypothetical protein [Phycisphaerales bacterium]
MNRTHLAIFVLLMLALSQGCASLTNADSSANSDLELLLCGLTKCPLRMFLCVLEPACRETLTCNSQCGSAGVRSQQQACHLACQLDQGSRSGIYSSLVQCFANNGCLPTLPEGTDGQCLVNSDNIHKVHVLESLDELDGTWLEIRGLNCGVPGSNWEGGYDALPCASDSWIYHAQQWWYHTSFCAPAENESCNEQGVVHLIAEPRLSDQETGLLEVFYINPPLQPQHERWYILSRPDPDWIMYTYCGSTPIGEYAGVNIMTRVPEPSNDAMPPEVEAAFRQAAQEFNFPYEDMCVTDQSPCPPVTAEADVREWVEGL